MEPEAALRTRRVGAAARSMLDGSLLVLVVACPWLWSWFVYALADRHGARAIESTRDAEGPWIVGVVLVVVVLASFLSFAAALAYALGRRRWSSLRCFVAVNLVLGAIAAVAYVAFEPAWL